MTVRAIHGDMLEAIPQLVAEGVVCDACVCDPPYHLSPMQDRHRGREIDRPGGYFRSLSQGFMGQQWDGGDIAFRPETWATVSTILRPGAFLLAFGGTRTYHRMACAIEDAGFVIQDCLMWLYSGFPKRRDALKPSYEPIVLAYKKPGSKRTMQINECRVGIAIESRPGGLHRGSGNTVGRYTGVHIVNATPKGRWPANILHDGSDEVVGMFPESAAGPSREDRGRGGFWGGSDGVPCGPQYGDSGSAARFFFSYQGAEEDQCKPGRASFAAACSSLLSEAADSVLRNAAEQSTLGKALNFTGYRAQDTSVTENELRSACDCVTALTQSIAQRFLQGLRPESITIQSGHAKCVAIPKPIDTMTITIMLWTSAGFAERATFDITFPNMEAGEQGLAKSRFHYSSKAGAEDRWGSRHPTVKPVELMKWLVKLVTPQGGLVLDPFAGSGTTGVAALGTGRNAILIEREDQYIADIRERLAFYEGGGTHSVQAKHRNRAVDHGPLFAEAAE